MLTINIVKWLFVFCAIFYAYYLYNSENSIIRLFNKHIKDNQINSELKSSARRKMLYLVLLFTAFLIWILSYDLIIEKIELKNFELTQELEKTSEKFENLSKNQQRLVAASKEPDQFVVDDVKDYYSDLFVNYYVMRKCDMTETDDMFIINSALMREIGLNNLPFELRDQVIQSAKVRYLKKFSDFKCEQIYGRYNDIIKNYQNYIVAVREVLKATF